MHAQPLQITPAIHVGAQACPKCGTFNAPNVRECTCGVILAKARPRPPVQEMAPAAEVQVFPESDLWFEMRVSLTCTAFLSVLLSLTPFHSPVIAVWFVVMHWPLWVGARIWDFGIRQEFMGRLVVFVFLGGWLAAGLGKLWSMFWGAVGRTSPQAFRWPVVGGFVAASLLAHML